MKLNEEQIQVADSISTQITDVVNAEISRQIAAGMKPMPAAILVGQCLAMVAYMLTAPQKKQPLSFTALMESLHRILADITGPVTSRPE